MNRNWRWVLPWYFWTLPLALVGFILMPIYGAHSFRWNDGVLTALSKTYVQADGSIAPKIWGKPAGQTFAWIQFYASEKHRSGVKLRVHETVHTVQAIWFAIGGALLLPICFMLFGGSLWLGLLLGGWVGAVIYGILYFLFFLSGFLLKRTTNWRVAYRANPFEEHAYRIGDKGHGWGE